MATRLLDRRLCGPEADGTASDVPDQGAAWRTHNVGRLMFAATDVFVREKLRSVHAGGFGAATEVQMALVQNLDLHGTRLTTIAFRASMTKQSMLELVNKAEMLGLVERRTDPEDRRAKVVVFTPLGLDLLDRVREGVVVAQRRMTTVMGADFVFAMQEMLASYVAATNPTVDKLKISDRNEVWRKHSINRVLMLASGVFVQDMLRVVHDDGFDTVAEVHLALFRNLDLGGTCLTQIASRARMTKQAMAELVDQAERLGFVMRLADPDDRRVKTVVFTPAGLQMLEQHRFGVKAAERRMAALTGPAFVAALRKQLTAYVASTEMGTVKLARLQAPGGLS